MGSDGRRNVNDINKEEWLKTLKEMKSGKDSGKVSSGLENILKGEGMISQTIEESPYKGYREKLAYGMVTIYGAGYCPERISIEGCIVRFLKEQKVNIVKCCVVE